MSKIAEACETYADLILEGTMLSVDPGSTDNVGYAYWEEGELVESGVFKAKYRKGSWHRLRELAEQLEANYPYVDVLAVEHVALGRVKNARLVSSLGMIFTAVNSEAVIMVPPISWRKYIDKETYEKTDENDSISIGWCCINKANGE